MGIVITPAGKGGVSNSLGSGGGLTPPSGTTPPERTPPTAPGGGVSAGGGVTSGVPPAPTPTPDFSASIATIFSMLATMQAQINALTRRITMLEIPAGEVTKDWSLVTLTIKALTVTDTLIIPH